MSSFKIDLKTVEQLRSRHSQLSSSLSNAAARLSSAAYGVDPAIKARRQLQYRISYATQRLRGLEDRMYNISDFMRRAIEQYDSAEGQIKSKVGEITGRHRRSWLENLFDGVGDAYNALTEWLASEDGQRFTEQAKANAVPPANSCPAPEEPIDYRSYLGEYDRETPGVDALYFVDADGNRMQVDFSKLEQLVGEYYYISNLMLIPGFVLDERESDYTDFFIYAIKQGYDPRTFQPIDAAEAENIQNYINGRVQTYEMYRQEQKVIGSLTLDLLPVIGQVKSAIELWTGENLVTGDELNGWDYGFGIAGAIAPAIKGGRGLYKGYKSLTAVDEAVDVGRVIEDADVVIDGLKVIDDKVLGKIPLDDFANIRSASIHNPNADSIVLGKYTPTYENGVANWKTPGPDSYVSKAGSDSTYFSLGSDWDKIKETYDLTDKDMFNLFNIPALDDAVSSGKTIKFSHDPSLEVYADSALADEWNYLQTKYGFKTLKEVGGFWIAK